MANTVLTVLVIAVGTGADLGVVSLLARVRPLRRKDRIRKAARLVWAMGFLVALLAAVLRRWQICWPSRRSETGSATSSNAIFQRLVTLSSRAGRRR
jgi:hypothetical protein